MNEDCNSCKRLREEHKSTERKELLEIIYMIHKGCDNDVFKLLDIESKDSLKNTVELPLSDNILFNLECVNCKSKYSINIHWFKSGINIENIV